MNLFSKGESTLRTGFEPAREYPIGFQVQRLNHSAIAANEEVVYGYCEKINLPLQ